MKHKKIIFTNIASAMFFVLWFTAMYLGHYFDEANTLQAILYFTATASVALFSFYVDNMVPGKKIRPTVRTIGLIIMAFVLLFGKIDYHLLGFSKF